MNNLKNSLVVISTLSCHHLLHNLGNLSFSELQANFLKELSTFETGRQVDKNTNRVPSPLTYLLR